MKGNCLIQPVKIVTNIILNLTAFSAIFIRIPSFPLAFGGLAAYLTCCYICREYVHQIWSPCIILQLSWKLFNIFIKFAKCRGLYIALY